MATSSARTLPSGSMGRFQRSSGPAFDGPPAIDLAHLARQSLGDSQLERELLHLFDIQSARIASELGMPDPKTDVRAVRLELAHTLKGSASAVGAHRVSTACDTLETLLRTDAPQPFVDTALRDLRMAIHAARDFIAATR